MKKLFSFFVMLVSLLPLVAYADVSVKVDRTNWSISACNTCPTNYEGDYNGNISAAIDASTTTYYHSDWSGSSTTEGNSGLQAFLIDMGEDVADLCGFDYCARSNSASGHVYTCRVYVYADGALPSALSDLASLTSTTKETTLASTNTALGTAVYNNSSSAWTYSANTDVQTGTFTKTTGRYVLFIQDTGYDAWLTCADFNVYQAQSSGTYTITISGADGATVTYGGKTYSTGGTITSSSTITSADLTASIVDGYYSAITVNGTDIAVNYYKEYAKEGQAYLIKNVASGAFLNTTTLVSSNISIQTEGTPVYFTHDNGSWYINDASDNSGNYVYTDGWWNCKPSTTKTAWTIVETDTEGDYRLQCSTGYLAPDAASAGAALWTDKAATHSYGVFEIVTYDIDAYVSGLETAIANAQALIGTNPGNYEATAANTAIAAAQAAIDASDRTITSLLAAQETLATALAATVIKPTAGKIYMLVSAYPGYLSNQNVEKAVYDNAGTSSWKTLDGSDMTMYWYIQPDDAGTGYTIQNYSTSNYLSDYAATSTTATSWYLKGLAKGTYGYEYGITKTADFSDSYGYLHTGGHSSGAGVSGNTTYWVTGADGASAWYIREVSDPNLNAAIASLQNKVDSCNAYKYGTNIGYYPAADSTKIKSAVTTAQAVLDGGSTLVSTYTTALETLNSVLETVSENTITSGSSYRFVSAYSGYTTTKSISALTDSYSPGWKNDELKDPTQYWVLTSKDDGYTAFNTFSGLYLVSPTDTTSVESKAAVLRFEKIGSGQFHIFFGTGTTPVHTAGWGWSDDVDRQGPLTNWAGGVNSPSAWTIAVADTRSLNAAAQAKLKTIQVDSIPLTAGATVVSPTEFATPSVVNAAIASAKNVAATANVAQQGAAYMANYKVITPYVNAIASYGALRSMAYTAVKGWNTISLPINWVCPEGWYRFNCDSLRTGSDTLSVSSIGSGYNKNTPMLIYANSAGQYQFIGYETGANDSVNVSNRWLTGIQIKDNTKAVVTDTTTTYVIDAASQAITKISTTTDVDLYHCYIKADAVLTYSALHFPACNTTALKNALATANSYTSLIGTGLGKYVDSTSSLQSAITEGSALTSATDYSQQIAIDTAVVHLNKAINGLTINQPEAGKYYRIKETKGGTYFAARSADNYLVKESEKSANSIFYLDADKKLLSYSRGLYLTTGVLKDNAGNGCNAISLAEADSANFTVQFLKAATPGCYVIRNSKDNTNFYHWEWSSTNVMAMTNNNSDTRTFVTLEQVDSLPLSLTKIGVSGYATLYLPVAVELCGDSVAAYTASVTDDTFNLSAISDNVIPAETGVVLKSTGCTSGVAIVTTTTATVDDNVLTGTIYSTHQENAPNPDVYVFGKKNGALGFYHLTATTPLTGGRAYYNPESSTSVNGFTLNFEEVATAIQQIGESDEAAIYDLSGRRVQQTGKGIYIKIKDSKKYMVK